MIQLKVDVLDALKDKGYSSYRLRKDKKLGESVLTKLRNGVLPSWHELDIICGLLDCQPGDLLEFVSDYSKIKEEELPDKLGLSCDEWHMFVDALWHTNHDAWNYLMHNPEYALTLDSEIHKIVNAGDTIHPDILEKRNRLLDELACRILVDKEKQHTTPEGISDTQEQPR